MNSRPKNPLRLRRIAVDTHRENVVYLHRRCPAYRTEGFQALSKIEVCADGEDSRHILAVLNVVDDGGILREDQLGLSEQAFAQLGLAEGSACRVEHADPPASLDAIHRKIAGESLSQADFRGIARDIVENRYSKVELSAFLVSSSQNGLERDEILSLTRSMVESGERLDWGEPLVADKHCIGGVPGNRTSIVVVPIVAAHGLLIPKTSSRAITSPAGTADSMAVLARVQLSPEELEHIVHRERGCLAWGGTAELAPMDDILISVERPLSLDSPGQMIASILSKKVAAGATHLLLDIPVGPTAKIRSRRKALELRKNFEYVADRLGLHLEVLLTDGSQPIGRGIGPVLEARDVMAVLENDPDAPADLREKALRLAGRVLEFDPDVRGGSGLRLARELLESGRALDKLHGIIEAQGPPEREARLGSMQHAVPAARDGYVLAIDNLCMARIARLAGAPLDPGAGIYLHKKVGERVREGEPLYTIHAEFEADFSFARERARADSGYEVGEERARSQLPGAD